MSNIYLLSAIDHDLQMPENDNLGIFNDKAELFNYAYNYMVDEIGDFLDDDITTTGLGYLEMKLIQINYQSHILILKCLPQLQSINY